jgi:hypothetical protein
VPGVPDDAPPARAAGPRLRRGVRGLLATHGLFVEAHLEHTSAVPNNHFVADLVGLLHLGVLFPELPGARAWRERAADGLVEQMRRQVLDDGFSFEGSTSYHRLATELFTMGLLAAQAGRVDWARSTGSGCTPCTWRRPPT